MDILWETNIAAWKYLEIYVLYWKIRHVPASYVCWQKGSQLGYLSNIGCHLPSPCEHMFCIFWQGMSWFLNMFMIKFHAIWKSGLKSLHPNIISLNIWITCITVQPVPNTSFQQQHENPGVKINHQYHQSLTPNPFPSIDLSFRLSFPHWFSVTKNTVVNRWVNISSLGWRHIFHTSEVLDM